LVAGSGNLTGPQWLRHLEARESTVARRSRSIWSRTTRPAILVASNGLELAPRSIAIEWDIADEEVEIPPITYVGVGLMALGSIAGLWAAVGFANKYRSSRTSRPEASEAKEPKEGRIPGWSRTKARQKSHAAKCLHRNWT
jgi:hypothetical protein